MKYHYTYRITNICLNKHYYGSRSSILHPSQDLGHKYFSSSSDKDFINEQKTHPERYKYKIVAITTTRMKATLLEAKLHSHYRVASNPYFYNLQNQLIDGFSYEFSEKIRARIKKGLQKILPNGLSINESRIKNGVETKLKTGCMSEAKNGNAKTFFIYDNNDNLIHTVTGKFKQFCQTNNCPYTEFMRSYTKKELVYDRDLLYNHSRIVASGKYAYKGWKVIRN